jgi:hypothetical protein
MTDQPMSEMPRRYLTQQDPMVKITTLEDERHEALLAVLERIATALETIAERERL